MVEINSFEEAYNYLEDHSLEHRHIFDLGNIFNHLIEKYVRAQSGNCVSTGALARATTSHQTES